MTKSKRKLQAKVTDLAEQRRLSVMIDDAKAVGASRARHVELQEQRFTQLQTEKASAGQLEAQRMEFERAKEALKHSRVAIWQAQRALREAQDREAAVGRRNEEQAMHAEHMGNADIEKAEHKSRAKMETALLAVTQRRESECAERDALMLNEAGLRVCTRLLSITKQGDATVRQALVRVALDTAIRLTNMARALADSEPGTVRPVARRLTLWPELVKLSGKAAVLESEITQRLQRIELGGAFPYRAVGSKSRSKLFELLCQLYFGFGVEVFRKIVIEKIVEHDLDGRRHTHRATDEDNTAATLAHGKLQLVGWTKRDGTPCRPPRLTVATLPNFLDRTMRLLDGPYGPQLIERVYGPVKKKQNPPERSDIKRDVRRVLGDMITDATGKE
jgi:hypothetical protein